MISQIEQTRQTLFTKRDGLANPTLNDGLFQFPVKGLPLAETRENERKRKAKQEALKTDAERNNVEPEVLDPDFDAEANKDQKMSKRGRKRMRREVKEAKDRADAAQTFPRANDEVEELAFSSDDE